MSAQSFVKNGCAQLGTLVLLMLMFTTICNAYYYSSSNSNSGLEQRMDKLEEKMDILINEVKRWADATVTEVEKSDKADASPVTLVAVENKMRPDRSGSEVKVIFTRNVGQVVQKVYSEGEYVDMAAFDEGHGKLSVNISCNFTNNGCDNILISFMEKTNNSYGLEIEVDAGMRQPPHQATFVVPELELKNKGDLVYYLGGDVTLEVLHSSGQESSGVGFEELDTSLFGMHVISNQLIGKYSTGSLVDVTAKKTYLESTESEVLLKMSEGPLGGILDVSQSWSTDKRELVKTITVKRSVVVRPNNQSGPFPDGFLDFLTNENLYGGEPEPELCLVNKVCSLNCDLVAAPGAELRVVKVNEDGSNVTVANATKTKSIYGQMAEWKINSTENDPDPVYQCIAENKAHGTDATLNRTVLLATNNLTFDRELSTFVLNEETGELFVQCVVLGRPIINARVVLEFSELIYRGYSQYMHYPAYLVTSLQPINGSHAMTNVTAALPNQSDLYGVVGATCLLDKASVEENNYSHSHSRQHTFYVAMPASLQSRVWAEHTTTEDPDYLRRLHSQMEHLEFE